MADDPPRRESIRTMKTDTEELMKKGDSSFLDFFAKGEGPSYDRGYKKPTSSGLGRRKFLKTLLRALTVMVVLGAAGGGAWWYWNWRQETLAPPQVTIPRAFLASESTVSILIQSSDRTGLLKALEEKKKTTVSPGQYLSLSIIKDDFGKDPELVDPQEFFEILRIALPTELADNLTGRWNFYMNGGVVLMIFEVKDRLKTFGSMLEWERRGLERELVPVLGEHGQALGETRDVIIKNNDARVLRFTDGGALGYSIIVGKLLLISNSEEALEGAIERIVALPLVE